MATAAWREGALLGVPTASWRQHGSACGSGVLQANTQPPTCLPPARSLAGRHGGRVLCHQRRRDAADGPGGLALCLPAGEGCCMPQLAGYCIWLRQRAWHVMPSCYPFPPFPQVAVISVATAALVYCYAVDPRHLEHHPSLHSGTAGLHRPGSGQGSSAAAAAAAGADVEGQKAGQRPAPPLTWHQVCSRVPAASGSSGSCLQRHVGPTSQSPCLPTFSCCCRSPGPHCADRA